MVPDDHHCYEDKSELHSIDAMNESEWNLLMHSKVKDENFAFDIFMHIELENHNQNKMERFCMYEIVN